MREIKHKLLSIKQKNKKRDLRRKNDFSPKETEQAAKMHLPQRQVKRLTRFADGLDDLVELSLDRKSVV